MIERKIGDIFSYEDATLKVAYCKNPLRCDNCFFSHRDEMKTCSRETSDTTGACAAMERSDRQYVIFKDITND